MYHVRSTKYNVPSTKYKVGNTRYEVQSRKYEIRNTKYEIVPQAEFPTSTFCTGHSSFDISLDLVLRISYLVLLNSSLLKKKFFHVPHFPTSIFCTGRSAFVISLNLVLRISQLVFLNPCLATPHKIFPPSPISLPRNNYFFLSCRDGKFRCFGKKIQACRF